jgi:hypothetical protein
MPNPRATMMFNTECRQAVDPFGAEREALAAVTGTR